MRYLIYNTFEKAQERCEKAFVDINCYDPNTTAYAIPVKHINEDLWAVCIDDNFKYLFTEEEISISEELTEDWFPKFELAKLITFLCLKCNIESGVVKINERYICVCDKCNTLIYSKLTFPK